MNTKINGKKVIIFGGTGFIGSHLINSLCKNSCQVDVVTRKNIKKLDFFIGNEPGQVRIVKIEKFQKDQLDQIITGSEILFNLIGILYEKKKGDFIKAHIDIPRELAASASRVGLRNFIHVSALNVEKSKDSLYANSKMKGEEVIKNEFPDCVIVRPSVVFGKRDGFTNLFSDMSKFSPFLPLVGTPAISRKKIIPIINFEKKVKFQPVYVGDLVKFLVNINTLQKKTYDIAGPSIQSFEQIFKIILSVKDRKRLLIPIPFFIAKLMAFFFEFLPRPPLTRDQVTLLRVNSVSAKGFQNLKNHVKNPSSLQTIAPTYL